MNEFFSTGKHIVADNSTWSDLRSASSSKFKVQTTLFHGSMNSHQVRRKTSSMELGKCLSSDVKDAHCSKSFTTQTQKTYLSTQSFSS